MRPSCAKREWDMEAEYFGNTGINTCAIAAFNVAMWDAWGRTVGQPVWKMLGANITKDSGLRKRRLDQLF